jgi:hypothetical protein
MSRYIIKHAMPDGEERYLVWSTIVDAPVTFGVTLEELRSYWQDEYGRLSLADFDRRFTCGGDPETLEYVQPTNRAGVGETRLSIEQIVDYYFVRRGKGEQPRGDREGGIIDLDKEAS